jgi:hypothetical protein
MHHEKRIVCGRRATAMITRFVSADSQRPLCRDWSWTTPLLSSVSTLSTEPLAERYVDPNPRSSGVQMAKVHRGKPTGINRSCLRAPSR